MNQFIEWIMGIVTKSVNNDPSWDSQPVRSDLAVANRTTGQPEAFTGHSLGGLGHEDDDRHDY